MLPRIYGLLEREFGRRMTKVAPHWVYSIRNLICEELCCP